MGKIYTDYDEYLQDAYEEQVDKYTLQHERAQDIGKDWSFSEATSIPGV